MHFCFCEADLRASWKINSLKANHLNDEIKEFSIQLNNGCYFSILNLGCAWHKLCLNGSKNSLVLGLQDLEGYLTNPNYLGVVIGRFANRIKDAKFEMDGQQYNLDKNNGNHHLHGGKFGLSHQFWQMIESEAHATQAKIVFSICDSANNYYPGQIDAKATFDLNAAVNNQTTLKLTLQAKLSQKCPLNLTYHPYFNLGDNPSIAQHQFQINADQRSELNTELIATGKKLNLSNTDFDLRQPRQFSEIMKSPDPQIVKNKGIDCHYFTKGTGQISSQAKAFCAETKIALEVSSTSPGVQFYTAGGLNQEGGHNNQQYSALSAFCFEPQLAPYSIESKNGDYECPFFSADHPFFSEIEYKFRTEVNSI